MKKQFFRVKQLADQTFSRAGKTEALSDDLQGAERRIEFIKNVCQSSAKKLANPGVDVAREKRMKKNADYCLGAAMIEGASNEEDRLLKEVVTHCGTLLMCLATTHVDHEIKVETKVVEPMSKISENDYPNIIKQKKNLTKLILDMDSARTRYQTAVKHHNSSAGSKADSIKDELEEAELKVEQCRDLLACDMLHMMSRESDVSQTILEFAQLLKNYHTAALAVLDKIIPEIELAIDESPCRPVFGKPLEEHLKVSGRKIAFPVELCVTALLELGIAEEGLFRVTAGASKVKRMKLSIDANWPNLDLNSALQVRDPHVFTVVLKSYLRELPEPLLTHQLYDQWMAAARLMSSGQTDAGLTALWTALKALPQANLNNLHYLIKFFSSLASNKQTNKMTTQNLAIVIAPNLLWAPSEDLSTMGLNMNTANLQSVIVDTLLSYVDWFFPEEIEFYQTLSKPDISPRIPNGHLAGEESEASPQHQYVQVSLQQGIQQTQNQAQGQQPEVIIKRTLSNSSLSDQHSPPMGSPKPAMRSRRQKPAAPNPPVNRASFSGGKSSLQSSLSPQQAQPPKEEKKDQQDHMLKPVEHSRPASTDSAGSVTGIDRSPGNPFCEKDDEDAPGNPFDSGGEEDNSDTKLSQDIKTTPTAKSRPSIQPMEDPPPDTPSKHPVSETPETKPQVNNSLSRSEMTFSAYEKVEEDRPSLSRGMSKSGEGLDTYRHQVERAASSAEQRRPDRPERPYSTLDRKKPSSNSRPVPAPRVTLDASKPCIPERPANLPRPHSSSFRISRNTSDSSPDQCDNPVNLERAHMYSVDKQQVSYIHFDKSGGEKGENADKPEKPKKPSYLPQSGHQRAMSEGSIIDTGLDRLKLQMSAPPPPPTSSSSNNDCTNL